ncbi:Serine/threonine/tyrosine-interacting protein B [Armadillidium nasatum]|uniref:Serine/threonine/tyrosine-interacting protein B n=1 Tax=Armadillidium nasatum TaxID=96803 RepID=A0A5N5TGT5_9CRUS|nr:Serine/threonine/tyrosine-interacting protein B [Armadillidium nasatum]
MPENWVFGMKREMQEILPGLYLGPYNSASKSKFNTLLNHGITHIICIRQSNEANIIKPNFQEKFIYLIVEMEDTMMQNIIPHILKCKDFIDRCIGSGGKCLVHSCHGISRGPSIVIAYVMGKKSMSFEEAFEFVKLKRVCIYPNDHFVQQLKEYEVIYKAEQTAMQQGQCSQQNGKLKRKFDQSEEEDIRYQSFTCEPMDDMS